MNRTALLSLLLACLFINANAQNDFGYKLPPESVVKIVDAPQTPNVMISPDNKTLLILERPGLVTIADLSAPELRLAGLRINPVNNGPSREQYATSITIMNIDGTAARTLGGMPSDPRIRSISWAPDNKRFSFTNITPSSIELWMGDVERLTAVKIDDGLNTIFGAGNQWLADGSLLYLRTLKGRGPAPVPSPVPVGPVIQESKGGKGDARTFQDLLTNHDDELVFAYFATSQMMLWKDGVTSPLGNKGMITDISDSPDGAWLLVTMIEQPFSYLVPFYQFPTTYELWDRKGSVVRTLLRQPLEENQPRGYDVVRTGPRNYFWRADKQASLCWVEALDSGIYYGKEMKYHDRVFHLDAPFSGDPEPFIDVEKRFQRIIWGDDKLAVVSEGLSKTRSSTISMFSPSDPQNTLRKIFELNYDDRYNNPGSFVTYRNASGRQVLLYGDKGRSLYLEGQGASPEGDRPFFDKYDIKTGKTTRLWRSEAPWYETISEFIDPAKGLLLTMRQSVTEVPNYYIRDLKSGKLKQVTMFANPYPELAEVHKELVKYKRNDGVDLTFTLYLPAGYDKQKDGPLPTILWAYPREFNDPSMAGQVSGSPYSFTRISPSSVLVYVTQGYAVLNDASFPIVGVGDKEPNDTFIEQLVADAEAAVNKAVEMGVTDPARVAVSGHSYGAFMTANLLSHTRLFAAGIARSGAYNRTLTPFGFQNERRSFWEATDLYIKMSPFSHATGVKDPLLLIHGIADNNQGTFPIQSERYYAALKGAGAVTRLVLLPAEAHSYAARESILHMHWEYLYWLDRYVKNKK